MITQSVRSALFHSDVELLPQMNEIYELELAYAETQQLSKDELVTRGAYFASVAGQDTNHFRLCTGEALRLPEDAARPRRRFFEKNQFRTGYATHGLFPYRGKFHPQMIKGIFNMMGLKPGDTILDPTMGSGTTLVEASMLGIHSVGFDTSPFCEFMTMAKLSTMYAPLDALTEITARSEELRVYFETLSDKATPLRGKTDGWLPVALPGNLPEHWFSEAIWPTLLLALLDAKGFAQRSTRGTAKTQFKGIMDRYAFVAAKTQSSIRDLGLQPASARPLCADARSMPLPDASMDGIIFSPPYSFAVDYVENDAPHLQLLGQDLDALRSRMIGIRGGNLREKFHHYSADMAALLGECARVLRTKRFCTVIIGTNNLQLAKLFNCSPHEVEGLDELVVRLAATCGLDLHRRLSRRIVGLANTMRDEDILVFKRT